MFGIVCTAVRGLEHSEPTIKIEAEIINAPVNIEMHFANVLQDDLCEPHPQCESQHLHSLAQDFSHLFSVEQQQGVVASTTGIVFDFLLIYVSFFCEPIYFYTCIKR